MKVTPEQQLGFLKRDVLPVINAVANGYRYTPGDSDLDDEQPIQVLMTLGDFRRATRLHCELGKSL